MAHPPLVEYATSYTWSIHSVWEALMSYSRCRCLRVALLVVTVLFAAELVSAQQPAKRPITHADYDGWKTAQLPVLSRDGRYLAYNHMPSDGDGDFVVR